MKKMKTALCGLLCAAQLFCMAPAALAEQAAELPLLTPQTTVQELHDNPVLQAAGFYTYTRDKSERDREKWKDRPLSEYMGENVVEDCVASLNQLMRNYESGVQVTYKIYTDEEIAQEPSRNNAELYYFPADASYGKTKYAVILCGNVLTETEEVKEGTAAAYQLNQMGYTAFVLRYRTWQDMHDDAPAYDLGRAVQYITSHAEQFNVDTEDYALIGHSSGGHLVGLFGGKRLGYQEFQVPKPGALIMAYPVNYFMEGVPIYHTIIDTMALGLRYYDYSVSGSVTSDYPPVYFFYGKNDIALKAMCYPLQGPALEKSLKDHHVLYRAVVYENAPHGCGLGNGTDADGWLNDAVAFWEQQTK